MIEIIPNTKNKKKIKPYYILKYNYMIGDANGQTSEEVKISKDNPYLKRYVKLLTSLKPLKGTWGIVFDHKFHKFLDEGQITEDDYKFLDRLMHEESEDFDEIPEDDEYSWEFWEGVQGETEYSFLVFQGFKLTYVNEYREKFKTKIV